MKDSWNNVRTVCCRPWLVLPTVYSDALSYGEQLDKFCYSLNKLIENNNILPEYITEQIKEYISSGAIGEVVREILANYILNVKYPPKGITPAVGDGSADDTEALQGCIDYASENGGVVYFPYGSYLTQPLTMKSGVSLFGFDRYSTKVVLKGGATKALLNGNASGLSVCGLTLDGNSGIQVNSVNVVDITGADLMFNSLIIKDGHKLFSFVGDGHLQLDDIVFGNAVENCFSVDGNVIVQAKNLLFTALSKVGGVSVVDIKANGGNYDFNSVAKCDTCMMISGNDNNVVALIGGANEDFVDTGEHNNVEIVGHSKKEYYSGNVKKDAFNEEVTLQGTKSLHVIGESVVAIDSNSTESIDGTKSELVTGVSSAQYKGNRTVNGSNYTESFSGKKVINSEDIVLNPNNPLTYSKPEKLDDYFNYINFKDKNNNVYKVLVSNEKPFTIDDTSLIIGFCYVDKTLTGTAGNCAYLKTANNEFIIFDLGSQYTFNTIKSQLTKVGCTKIKAVVISHFDGDHTGDFATWKNNFDMTDTVFYLPLATSKFQYTELALNDLNTVFPNNEKVFPTNNDSVTFENSANDSFTIKFNNCGETTKNYYDENSNNYNDYSMCSYVIHGNDVIGFMGDISNLAQEYMYTQGLGVKLTAMTVPHHGYDTFKGYQPMWKIWNPQFAYVSNTNNQIDLTGLRSPMISILHYMGCKIAINSLNTDTTALLSTKNGIVIGDYYTLPLSWYGTDSVNEIYIDETYTGDIRNGNAKTPFTNFLEAINTCNGYPTLIHVVKWSKNVTINWKQNITIDLNDNTLPYLSLYDSERVIIKNGTVNGADLFDNIHCELNNIKATVGLVQNRGFMTFTNCNITATVDVAFTFNECYGIIKNGSATVNKATIKVNKGIVTGEFALAGFHKAIDTARLIWIQTGECFIGRTDDITAVLKNQLWYYSNTEPYKKELLFDTTESHYCFIQNDGSLKYLAFKDDIASM